MSTEKQLQNEALIRLMIAATYQDKKISIPEEEELEKFIDRIEWESGTAPDLFVMKETAVVRKALDSDETRHALISEQCSHFRTYEDKNMCMHAIQEIIQSDGTEKRESLFLAEVREALEKQI